MHTRTHTHTEESRMLASLEGKEYPALFQWFLTDGVLMLQQEIKFQEYE